MYENRQTFARADRAPLLSARNLSLTYPASDLPAVSGIDLDIAPGRSVAIMGASGSGKTSLLHLLAGILPPSTGTVTFHGAHSPVQVSALTDAERSRLRREQFGFVFQQGLLLDELTALENVAVARMLLGATRQQAEAEARHWLAAVGLAGLADRRLGQLSGGQAQRVALARAQITGAQLIFADEPTGSLDSQTGAEVMSALLGVVAAGRTLVLVTHDGSLAARCDRTVTMRDGRIVADNMVTMRDGRIVADSGWLSLYSNRLHSPRSLPASAHAARLNCLSKPPVIARADNMVTMRDGRIVADNMVGPR